MSSIRTFVLPALAIEAIGAHLPSFPRKIAAQPGDPWNVARDAEGRYTIQCSREAAMDVAKLLQAAGRSPLTSTEKTVACIEAAAVILTQLKRESPNG